jgi:hypothetical protein
MQEGILKKLNPNAQAPAKPYEHQDYPSVRYHRSGKTTVVNNADEHAVLMEDKDWAETPAAFAEAAPAEDAAAADPAAPKKSRK